MSTDARRWAARADWHASQRAQSPAQKIALIIELQHREVELDRVRQAAGRLVRGITPWRTRPWRFGPAHLLVAVSAAARGSLSPQPHDTAGAAPCRPRYAAIAPAHPAPTRPADVCLTVTTLRDQLKSRCSHALASVHQAGCRPDELHLSSSLA